jgi:hypothetical protein
MMRKLTEDDVQFVVLASPEEDVSYINDIHSQEARQWIAKQLEEGNVWAWCVVCVVAHWRQGLSGTAYLSCCSYENEQGFKEGVCYQDKKKEALADLQRQVDELASALAALETKE